MSNGKGVVTISSIDVTRFHKKVAGCGKHGIQHVLVSDRIAVSGWVGYLGFDHGPATLKEPCLFLFVRQSLCAGITPFRYGYPLKQQGTDP